MALEDCIKQICDETSRTSDVLNYVEKQANDILLQIGRDASGMKCVIEGPPRQTCVVGKVSHVTLAEALSRLNALSIGSISGQSFTATAGQTAFTLAAAVPNPAALEVEVNGALCQTPRDWNVAGTTLTFTTPLIAGDQVDARLFAV